MIGPVMIGPSSSHTAGVVRIGRVAMRLLGAIPEEAHITFFNSFARTYEGHGSDRAIIAGLLDFRTDDKRIRDAFEHAQQQGLQYHFRAVGNASTLHPNTLKLELRHGERRIEVVGESRGGGLINITSYNGFRANFSASLHTLIIMAEDVKGAVAFIANILAHDSCNIATLSVSRKAKNDLACHCYEMDSGLRSISLDYLRSVPWIREVLYIPDIDL